MSGCCLTLFGIEAAVCTVINLNELAVSIDNDCRTVAVGSEVAGVVLVEDPHCLACSVSSGDLGVVCPLTVNSLKLLAVYGNKLGVFVTCTLCCTSLLGASAVGTLAAVLTNALALVDLYGSAYALLCTYSLGALCIKALATGLTDALALVSVTLALVSANCILTIGGALAALGTYVLANVRSLGEGDTGDTHLSTYGTVVKEELTGKVARSSVRSNDPILAFLTGSECLLEVVSSSTLGRISDCIVLCIIVLTVSTVVNTNDLTVLVKDERLTPTVRPVECTLVCRGVNYEEIATKNGEILVDSDLLGKKVIVLIAYSNAYEIANNLNNSLYGGNVSTVGSGKSYGVRACNVYVEAAVVCNGDLNSGIVGRIEGAVIIGNGKAAEDSNGKIELSIGKVSKNLVVVTGDHGSLVNVRSENLLIVSPKKANNVAVLIDYVIVHEATAVGVNGSAAVTVLNYDRISACGNGKVLRKCRCNGNGLTVDLDRGNGACGSVGVICVNELGVSAVAALDYEAVSVDNCCNAVSAGDRNGNGSAGCIVEYTADSYVGGVVAVKSYEFLILEGKEIALPLGLAESVRLNLEGKSGESLVDLYGTGSSCGLAILVNRLVGDGVLALNLCIESVVVLDDKLGSVIALICNGNTEHKVDVVACIDLKSRGENADYRCCLNNCGGMSLTLVLTSIFCASRISALATGFTNALAFVLFNRGSEEKIAGCKGEQKNHYNCNYCQNS